MLRVAANRLCGGPLDDAFDLPFGAAGLVGDAAIVSAVGPRASRSLGPSVLWARRRGANRVRLVAESAEAAGVLARRSALLEADIEVYVWTSDGPVRSAAADVLPRRDPDPSHIAFEPEVVSAGADPVVEHGVVMGEVFGLEVCRVVDDAGAARLAVGVGAHDRETQRLVHGDGPESLRRVVHEVTRLRSSGADHPLGRLAPERSIRHRLTHDPTMLGFQRVVAAEPPVVRDSLLDDAPCVALADEGAAVVVCVGHVDADVVPFALDARLRLAPDADVAVVAAAGNLPTPIREIASLARGSVRFAEIPRSGR